MRLKDVRIVVHSVESVECGNKKFTAKNLKSQKSSPLNLPNFFTADNIAQNRCKNSGKWVKRSEKKSALNTANLAIFHH